MHMTLPSVRQVTSVIPISDRDLGALRFQRSLIYLSPISHRVRAGNQVDRISDPSDIHRTSNSRQPSEKIMFTTTTTKKMPVN